MSDMYLAVAALLLIPIAGFAAVSFESARREMRRSFREHLVSISDVAWRYVSKVPKAACGAWRDWAIAASILAGVAVATRIAGDLDCDVFLNGERAWWSNEIARRACSGNEAAFKALHGVASFGGWAFVAAALLQTLFPLRSEGKDEEGEEVGG